jgi:prolyl-tRNA synthetase
VWRHETKATRPFIRSREFHWIETHNVFATKEEAEKQVKEDMVMTERVMHQQFGVPFIPFKRPVWDRFPGAVDTYAADTLMPDGKVLQQPSTHMLGQNFSKPFKVEFEDRDRKTKFGWQTCYGPAMSRIIASIIATHGDDKGLMFPFGIAPLQVIIIPLGNDKKVDAHCRKLAEDLSRQGISAEVDGRDGFTAGWKFNEWEMKGVPIRLEIGPRELKEKKVTIHRRDNNRKEKVPESRLISAVLKAGEDLTRSLIARADRHFKGNIRDAKTVGDVRKHMDMGGFSRVSFCSIDRDGEPCADKLHDVTGGLVRGIRGDKSEKPAGKCIVCGKKAKIVAYVARQY